MTPAQAPARPYLRPREVAADLGVNESKVFGWICSGQLRGINVAARACGRPRWRISALDLQVFLDARSARPVPAPRRRRAADDGIIAFF
jgi:hypothetical protein